MSYIIFLIVTKIFTLPSYFNTPLPQDPPSSRAKKSRGKRIFILYLYGQFLLQPFGLSAKQHLIWYGDVGAGRGLQKLLIAEVENNGAARLLQDSQGDPRIVARLAGTE